MIRMPSDLRKISRADLLKLDTKISDRESVVRSECIAQGFGNVTPRERDAKISNGTAAPIEVESANLADDAYKVHLEKERRLSLTGTLHKPRW